jgi:class 3 adenylate cyclase
MDLQIALEHRDRVEEFRRKHRIGLLTLLFTDMVGSTQLKQTLGDAGGFAQIREHHAAVREILSGFPEGEEIGTSGDSFFIVFAKPSEAVKFSLLLQSRLRTLSATTGTPVRDRIGIHIGEVIIEERPGSSKPKDLYGIQVDICARVMSLGDGDQVLMTRSTFDNARQVLKGQEMTQIGPLTWTNHGSYLLQGVDEPLEVCEVGETGRARLSAPADSQKARRARPGSEAAHHDPRAANRRSSQRMWFCVAGLLGVGVAVAFFVRHRPAAIPASPDGDVLVRIGFEAGEGYLAGQPLVGRQGWSRGKWPDQLSDGGQGVSANLFPGSPQQAFIGGVPGATKPGVHASITRKMEFTPRTGGGAEVEVHWRQAVIDSNNAPRNVFEWLFFNQAGQLLGGLTFYNSTRRIMRRRPDNSLVDTGLTFDRGRKYDVKLRLDFQANAWTATIGEASLGPLPMADRNQAMNLGAITITWWSAAAQAPVPGGPVAGDNLLAFDDLEIVVPKAGANQPQNPPPK